MLDFSWVMDIVSIPHQAGLFRKLNTVHHIHSAGLNHVCCQSYCECMWPLDHAAHSLIVIQQEPTPPLLSSQAHFATDRLLLHPHPSKTTTATQLLFGRFPPRSVRPLAGPHNRWTVSVYSPFCPLCLVPPADLAPRPIPGERTCITVNWVLHSCAIWHSRKRLQLASCKKTDADRCLCHMFSTDQWITS